MTTKKATIKLWRVVGDSIDQWFVTEGDAIAMRDAHYPDAEVRPFYMPRARAGICAMLNELAGSA